MAVDELSAGVKGTALFNNFFFMLLWQKMYYADKTEIKNIAEGLKHHNLFKEINQNEVPAGYTGLFNDIEKSRYFKIRFTNLKTQLRHKVAVIVKSILKATRN